MGMLITEAQREDKLIYPVYKESCKWECDFHDACLTSKLGGDPTAYLENNFLVVEKED